MHVNHINYYVEAFTDASPELEHIVKTLVFELLVERWSDICLREQYL